MKEYLVFSESGGKLVFFLDEFLHLGGEGDVCEKEAAVLVIVAVFLGGVAESQNEYIWNSLSSSKGSIIR